MEITQLHEKLTIANNGRSMWSSLIMDYKIATEDYVVLIPKNERLFYYYALVYLKSFIQQRNKNVYIVASDDFILKVIPYFSIGSSYVILKNEIEVNSILELYNLYMFTDKLIVLSDNEPKNRSAMYLVKYEKLLMEQFISIGLFENKQFSQAPLVQYEGNDAELLEFFNMKKEGDY